MKTPASVRSPRPRLGLVALLALAAGASADLPAYQEKGNAKSQKEEGKERKAARKAAASENQDHYKKWLNEDVLYIVSDDERKVFKALNNSEEKDAFIEQFWRRRDPDPKTGVNEFKEEHYRRIAYANENFFSGRDGWATDRGRIYITLGPPTSIESNAGGAYRRRWEEGGGFTSTYAFQRWYYNEIAGVGRGVELEFVDSSNTGEYRLALRPSEKDALWNTGVGLTWEESMCNPDSGRPCVDRAGSMLSDLAMRNVGFNNEPFYMRGARSFDRVRNYFNVNKPPEVKFKDLRAEVEASISFNQIPVRVTVGSYRVGIDSWLMPLTVEVPADALSFKTTLQTLKQSIVNIYGKVENLTGTTVYEFEDQAAAYGDGKGGFASGTRFLYQRQLPLKPGRYKATVVLGEQDSKRVASVVTPVQVVAPQSGSLTTSSMVLGDAFASSLSSETLSDPFMTPSGLKVYPNLTGEFKPGATVSLYVEAYEVAVDQGRRQPMLTARQTLLHEGKPVRVEEPRLLQLDDRVVILNTLSLKGLPGGAYQVLLQLHDQVSGQSIARRSAFKISQN